MKKTLLFILLTLSSYAGMAQLKVSRVSIIPEPKSVTLSEGSVPVNARMKYFSNSESAERAAELFNTFLEANYKLRLEKGTMQNSTLIFSDDEMLPAEGYQLT